METCEKRVWLERDDGYREELRYRYPKITTDFASPLLNDGNLIVSGDNDWRRSAERVARGLKPLATLSARDAADAAEALSFAADHACQAALVEYTAQGRRLGLGLTIARQGPLADVFDFATLHRDYARYLEALGADAVVRTTVALALQELAGTDFADFLSWEGHFLVDRCADFPYKDAGEWAWTGTLLGYPLETTVAVIGQTLALPGCYASL